MLLSGKAKLIILIAFFFGLATVLFLSSYSTEFDVEALSIDTIMMHTQVLASETYEGRLTGSVGNQRVIEYITSYFDELGLEPVMEGGAWNQSFSVLMPRVEGDPEFVLYDGAGKKVHDFDMYRDFSVVFSPGGEGIDFEGEYVILGSDAYRVAPEVVEGRIAIVDSARLNYKIVAHIMSLGGRGVLCSADSNAYAGLSILNAYHPRTLLAKEANLFLPVIFPEIPTRHLRNQNRIK